MTDLPDERQEMVNQQIAARGVRDQLVLEAMATVPRESFLPLELREYAYRDMPLPIGSNQTISQPYIVAYMIEALQLRGGERVLEIGTGSGYAAAVLSRIASEVHTVERIEQLAAKSRKTLAELGYLNVHVHQGDGTRGWPDIAPYEGIIVAAGGPSVPQSLKSQLAIGGHLVMPVGTTPTNQELLRIARTSDSEFESSNIACVRFVPLIGDEGW